MRYRSPGILSLARWSGQLPSILHEDRRTQENPTILSISPTGLSPTLVACSKSVRLYLRFDVGLLQPHSASTVVWASPFSLAATHRVDVLFPFLRLLRCFSSPGSHPCGYDVYTRRGFPHSDIQGSTLISNSPWLIAGDRVLRRFWCQGIHRAPFIT